MENLDLRSSTSPMESVVSDENVKVDLSIKEKLRRDRFVVEDEEEEDEEEVEDEEIDDEEEEQEYFDQSQDEEPESSESPINKPSSSTACTRKKSLTKSIEEPGPSSSTSLNNSDPQWPPNTQPLKNQIDENKAHQIRLKNLRKHIDYIEQTNWLYSPIEELIGHTDSSNK